MAVGISLGVSCSNHQLWNERLTRMNKFDSLGRPRTIPRGLYLQNNSRRITYWGGSLETKADLTLGIEACLGLARRLRTLDTRPTHHLDIGSLGLFLAAQNTRLMAAKLQLLDL